MRVSANICVLCCSTYIHYTLHIVYICILNCIYGICLHHFHILFCAIRGINDRKETLWFSSVYVVLYSNIYYIYTHTQAHTQKLCI